MIAYRCEKLASDIPDNYAYTIRAVNSTTGVETIYGSSLYAAYANTTVNQSIYVGDNVWNCANMLYNCTNFDKAVYIGNNVLDCSYMLYNCINFNAMVFFDRNNSKVTNLYNMFGRCSNLCQDVTIPKSALDIRSMFDGCSNFTGNIYIEGNEVRQISNNLGRIGFTTSYNSLRKNFYFNEAIADRLLNGLTWTKPSANTRYNAGFNYYCYINYG